ncbi:hypothetical protein COCVIDRAFT_93106 [Bipolaris victoriae FI3]|uniref:Uncharacterized protein n=1 Tax=Bipolaris victoriae (strain FI3) TaxID=930091 RepID=W7EQN3_BIPV3|nr:hypothetical protein COCVIDRAFT_93106 [Bipolaris victoriae FI3]
MGGKVFQSEEFGCHGWFTNGHVVDVIFFLLLLSMLLHFRGHNCMFFLRERER